MQVTDAQIELEISNRDSRIQRAPIRNVYVWYHAGQSHLRARIEEKLKSKVTNQEASQARLWTCVKPHLLRDYSISFTIVLSPFEDERLKSHIALCQTVTQRMGSRSFKDEMSCMKLERPWTRWGRVHVRLRWQDKEGTQPTLC